MQDGYRSPEETQARRETVDAVREIIGLAPLYRSDKSESRAWLADVTDLYQNNKSGRTPRRGSARP